METELAFLEGMTTQERKLHYIAEDGREERARMERLMQEWQMIGAEVTLARSRHMEDMAIDFSAYRNVVRRQLKESRERVQWLRMEYKTANSSSK